jgi:hypothetical protein
MKPFPRLNTLIRTGLESYLSELEEAPFIDRQSNIVLPELIIELLRIDSEVQR